MLAKYFISTDLKDKLFQSELPTVDVKLLQCTIVLLCKTVLQTFLSLQLRATLKSYEFKFSVTQRLLDKSPKLAMELVGDDKMMRKSYESTSELISVSVLYLICTCIFLVVY